MTRRWSLAAALLLALLQFLAVLNPDVVEPDPEELYNAAHAYFLAHGHLGDAFRLQYRPFCGGCTLDALLAAPLLTVAPPRWPLWKLVPVGYLLLLLGVGLRRLPPSARLPFTLLLFFPPMAFLSQSMVAWGNHYEAGILAAVGLLLVAEAPRRPLLGGLALGGAVWVGFSGASALPAAVLWLLVQRDLRALLRLLVGMAVGVSPWLLLWTSAGTSPFGEIYGAGEAIPMLSHIPAQAMTLLHPRQVAGLLGHPWLGVASLPVVGAWGLAAWWARRHPLGQAMLLALLCWGGVYLLSGFHIPIPEAPQLPVPASLRYLSPVFPLLLVLLATAAGGLSPRRQAVLLALPLALGLLARVSVLAAPFPVAAAWSLSVLEPGLFRQQATYALSAETHRTCTAADAPSRALHSYALGRLGEEPLPDGDAVAFAEGAAEALIDRLDPSGEGSIGALSAGLAATEGGPDAGWRALLRARSGAGWLSEAIEGHDEDAVARLEAVLEGQPERLWWLVGWRWGEDVSRPLVPSGAVALPVIVAGRVPEDFAAGLGEALGRRWGGEAAIVPLNLPVVWQPVLREGYARGQQARW